MGNPRKKKFKKKPQKGKEYIEIGGERMRRRGAD